MGVHVRALELFESVADSYGRLARSLSFGRDASWRRRMVKELDIRRGDLALDMAAGTGSIARLVEERSARVVAAGQSRQMLETAAKRGAKGVRAAGETLPFPNDCSDAVTFGYLLRYVHGVDASVTWATKS